MNSPGGAGPARTVFERFEATAGRFPERPFLAVLPETAAVYSIASGEIAYRDALAAVRGLAARYRAAGYGAGQRVGLLLGNRPDFLLHWLALNSLGAGVVPINPDLRSAELEYLVLHSDMCLAVAVAERCRDLAEAARAGGRTLPVVAPDAEPPRADRPAPPGEPSAGGECALLYTSGTTGRPKGCVLANAYFLLAGDWYADAGGLVALAVEPPERMLSPLPLFHMNALAYSAMAMLTVGGCLALLDRFHPRTWWRSVSAFDATAIHYLGVMPALLSAAPTSREDRGHRVRFGFGAGVDGRLHRPFEERFGFPLIEAWAMTETGAGAVIAATREPRKVGTRCFGRPAPGIDVMLRTADGREAGIEEDGELLVRRGGGDPALGFFREYLKDPAATGEAWEGGWFHTGDIVRRDADSDLHFVDRKKNVIRRSGENISAIEVEGVLQRHEAVAQVAVAGTLDPIRGEEVVALIVPARRPADAASARVAAEEIVGWCLERLAYYKAPGFVAFVDALPLTATEKIQRAALKTAIAAIMEAGEAIDTRALKKRSA